MLSCLLERISRKEVRPMSDRLHKITRDGRNAGMLPGRTFERAQGCWNCVNFEDGEKARAYYKKVCRPRDNAAVKSYEAIGQTKAAQEMRELMNLARQAINTGGLGMCRIGKAVDKMLKGAK